MKFIYIFILVGMACVSCREDTMQDTIRENIGKEVLIEGLDSVRYLNKVMSYDEFRKLYKYVSIIYIDQNCSACKVEVLEWNRAKKLLKVLPRNIAYLFLYRGDRPRMYFKELSDTYELTQDDNDFHFFFIQDKDFKFVKQNKSIPPAILDMSILIDENNRITTIGAPFLNLKMMELYEKILKENE